MDASGGPGADFTALADALAGASDGDVLLFAPGAYVGSGGSPFLPPLVVSGKGRTLFADGVVEPGSFEIADLAPTQLFALRGISSFGHTAWSAEDSAGTLWVEQTQPSGPDPSVDSLELALDSCASVARNRCAFQGANSPNPGFEGVDLDGGFGFFSGSSLEPNLLLEGAAPTAILLDTVGTIDQSAGTVSTIGGTSRSFAATAVAREGQTVTVTWTGAPGDSAILNIGTRTDTTFYPAFSGTGLAELPLVSLQAVGSLPASVELSLDFVAPQLQPGVESVLLFSQGRFFVPSTGEIRVGDGSMTLLLDSVFSGPHSGFRQYPQLRPRGVHVDALVLVRIGDGARSASIKYLAPPNSKGPLLGPERPARARAWERRLG
ncbi:MAG: hypothetical protein AAFZ65_02225 [Planctomycetota bacterium]